MSRYSQHLAAIWTDKVLACHPLQNKTLANWTMGSHSGTTHGRFSTNVRSLKIPNTVYHFGKRTRKRKLVKEAVWAADNITNVLLQKLNLKWFIFFYMYNYTA